MAPGCVIFKGPTAVGRVANSGRGQERQCTTNAIRTHAGSYALRGCTMVLRYPACIVPVALLVLGLRPTTGRVFPRFVLGGGISSGRLGEGRAQYQQQDTTGSSSLRERTALRLGEGGHSCVVPGGTRRRGAWGLTVVRAFGGRPADSACHCC